MIDIPVTPYINMPVIGFGTWQVPADDAASLVRTALKVGYNHIDCARIYMNEHTIGSVFHNHPDRKNIFVTSKLWCDSHDKSKVFPSCKETLANLKLDYLDMYLIHNPVRTESLFEGPMWFKKEWLQETWREMVKLKEQGLCKHVGVSNFTTVKLDWVSEVGETPSNNQVELHPYNAQANLLKYCEEHKIVVTAYSPLGTPATRTSFPSIGNVKNPILMEDPCINEIAKKYSATAAQVLLKWGMLRGTPVLAKSSSESRMFENLSSIKLQLTEEDMKTIGDLDRKVRYLDFQNFCSEGHTVVEYWDQE